MKDWRLDALRELDYSGNIGDALGRITPELMKGLVDDINAVGDKPSRLVIYMALRLRSAAEGYPGETPSVDPSFEIPELGGLTSATLYLIILENMRRKGELTVEVWPRVDHPYDEIRFTITESGRKRHAELEARHKATARPLAPTLDHGSASTKKDPE